MINKISIFILLSILFIACNQDINEFYYKDTEASVDTDILSLLKQNDDYSQFVALLEKYQVDTLLNKGKIYTFFVPDNSAMGALKLDSLGEKQLVEYLMSESFVSINQIPDFKQIQTQSGKFATIQNTGNGIYTLDGVAILNGSPLANNGRYYEIAAPVQPKPNLFEYIAATNEFYNNFIKSLDSIYLDKELSTPIGYTQDGLTIYDSVMTKINIFEELYFPVSKEFRDRKATMLLFSQAQYEQAINNISIELGLPLERIPKFWQNNVLMPYLIHQSVFRNSLQYSSFLVGKAKNIVGDSVIVEPANIAANYVECSNGRVYNLINFKIPESLYKVNSVIPMNSLIYSKGTNLWGWNQDVILTGQAFNPVKSDNPSSQFKSTLLVDMGKSFKGSFSLAYKHKNIFPATYKLTLRANVSKTGIYKLFVNGKLYPVDIKDGKGPRNEFDFFDLRSGVIGSVTNKFYPFKDNFCSFEIYVDNLTEFGDVEVKLVYVNPSPKNLNNCGLNIDFISLEFYKK